MPTLCCFKIFNSKNEIESKSPYNNKTVYVKHGTQNNHLQQVPIDYENVSYEIQTNNNNSVKTLKCGNQHSLPQTLKLERGVYLNSHSRNSSGEKYITILRPTPFLRIIPSKPNMFFNSVDHYQWSKLCQN